MPPKAPHTLWDKLFRAVRNDPQKAGILTVLGAILVVLQIRLQMTRQGPSSATASTSIVSSQPKSGNPAVASGGQTNASATPAIKSRDNITSLRDWMDAPPAPLSRNLFAVDIEKFPQDGSPLASMRKEAPGFWDELAKSMTFRADVRKERQILIENLQQQAGQLKLQSTMMGATPRAVIDGEMVRVGDVVASFRVLKIEARRIIVEREGIKLEILMK